MFVDNGFYNNLYLTKLKKILVILFIIYLLYAVVHSFLLKVDSAKNTEKSRHEIFHTEKAE